MNNSLLLVSFNLPAVYNEQDRSKKRTSAALGYLQKPPRHDDKPSILPNCSIKTNEAPFPNQNLPSIVKAGGARSSKEARKVQPTRQRNSLSLGRILTSQTPRHPLHSSRDKVIITPQTHQTLAPAKHVLLFGATNSNLKGTIILTLHFSSNR